MKKYLAFYGTRYYPMGGMLDLIGSFDTLFDANVALLEENKKEGWEDSDWGNLVWGHIWDIEKGVIVVNLEAPKPD